MVGLDVTVAWFDGSRRVGVRQAIRFGNAPGADTFEAYAVGAIRRRLVEGLLEEHGRETAARAVGT